MTVEPAEWSTAPRPDAAHARRKGRAFRVPERLSSFDATWSARADAPIRQVPLSFQRAGATRLWEFVNPANQMMGMSAAHPIHLHGRQSRVVARTGGQAANPLRSGLLDAGWKDTVLVLLGESVRVQTRHPGLYL